MPPGSPAPGCGGDMARMHVRPHRGGDRSLGYLKGGRLGKGAGRVRAALESLQIGGRAQVRARVRGRMGPSIFDPELMKKLHPVPAGVQRATPLRGALRLERRPRKLPQPACGTPYGHHARVLGFRQTICRPSGQGHLAQEREAHPAQRKARGSRGCAASRTRITSRSSPSCPRGWPPTWTRISSRSAAVPRDVYERGVK